MLQEVRGQWIDIGKKRIVPACILIKDDRIQSIHEVDNAPQVYILPGFVDAHIHIESSMLVPSQFAKAAVVHGTVATVSDPHEIANVCGLEGIRYMLSSAASVPLKFHFGAPSCVPATSFETSGAHLGTEEIRSLMERDDIYYLSEVMNFPAVLHRDAEMMEKLNIAQKSGKPIDGHAPGMRYPDTEAYFSRGISTDHECFEMDEALDKIKAGCKILIREGSAAKNFDALIGLMKSHPDKLMFCSDDLHPDDLIRGHINLLVKRAVALGYSLYDVLYAACVHPVLHYGMKAGLLRAGDPADFIVVDNPLDWNVLQTWINGKLVAEQGKPLFNTDFAAVINHFHIGPVREDELRLPCDNREDKMLCRIIQAIDGQLITRQTMEQLPVMDGYLLPDPQHDILKIAVINRYQASAPSIGFIKNFGLIPRTAIASTVAHDSHNIVAVGSDEETLCRAINALIRVKGGIVFADSSGEDVLPLPVAGLMTLESAQTASEGYQRLSRKAQQAGCPLTAPFMTLSFMALPVIPELKITDLGLFDTGKFTLVDISIPGPASP